MAAAVADFTLTPSPEKLKKRDGLRRRCTSSRRPTSWPISSRKRRDGQVVVGFAAETTNVVENARAKLPRKDVDLLVVNDVAAPGAGFEHDDERGRAARPTRRAGTRVAALERSGCGAILARVAALLAQGAQ